MRLERYHLTLDEDMPIFDLGVYLPSVDVIEESEGEGERERVSEKERLNRRKKKRRIDK